jgi:hypothetical protein
MTPQVEDEPSLPWEDLTGLECALVVVYNPPNTRFLESVAQEGLKKKGSNG